MFICYFHYCIVRICLPFLWVNVTFKGRRWTGKLVGNAAPLIGGMFFPVTVLPKFLRYVSYVFPFTWA